MSLTKTILLQQGAYVPGAAKVIDNPFNNIALGALGCAVRQSDPSNPKTLVNNRILEEISKSWGKDASYIKHQTGDVSFVTSRSFTVTANENTTDLISVNMGYCGFNVIMYEQNYRNSNGGALNMVSYEQDMNKKMQAGFNAMKEYMETAILAALETSKTKIVRRPLDYKFVGDSIVATNAQKEEIFASIVPIIKGNNYDVGEYLDLVATVGVEDIALRLIEQGTQNNQNKAIRLQNKQIWTTNSIPANPGKFASFYAVPDGSLGIVTRRQPNCVNDKVTKDWDFYTMDASTYGIPWRVEVRETEVGFDSTTQSENDKNTTDVALKMQIGVDFAILTPISSGSLTIPSPVVETQINTAATDADVTAPLVDAVTSAALTSLTIEFDEVMSSTEDGGTLLADTAEATILAGLSVVGAPLSSISAATVSADSTELTLTVVDGGDLVDNTDLIAAAANSFFDTAGNKLAAGNIARVNAGGTAWEAIP